MSIGVGLTEGPGRRSPPPHNQGWFAVIVVTRLNGGQFGVNPDLIQRVDSAPDTILTLIDGTKLIVAESMDEVIARINEHRASILARSHELQELSSEPIHSVARPARDADDDPDNDRPTPSVGQLRRVR